MKKRKMGLIVLAFVFVAIISGLFSGLVVAAWPLSDVSPSHWAYNYIKWLYDNGITTGYPDNTYRPSNTVQRDEMAAFLQRQAGATVAAGAHVEPKVGGGMEITEWFNNVNGQKPTLTWDFAWIIDFHFKPDNRFPVCTVDMDGSLYGLCTVKFLNEKVRVGIYDVDEDSFLEPIGFWILVFGNDIQP